MGRASNKHGENEEFIYNCDNITQTKRLRLIFEKCIVEVCTGLTGSHGRLL
jgi:hypothetical protein